MFRRFALLCLVVAGAVLLPTSSASATLVPCDEGRSGANYAHACVNQYGDRYEWRFTPSGSQFAYLEVSADRSSWVTMDVSGYVSTPYNVLTVQQSGARYWRIRILGGATIGGTATDTIAVGGSGASVPGGYVPPNECGALDVGCNFDFAFRYFLIPSNDTLDKWSDLGASLGDKPPFGYFTDFWGALDDLFSSGPGESEPVDLTITIPSTDGSADKTLVAISSDSAGGQAVAGLRPVLLALLWMSSLIPLGVYLWRRMFPVVEG